MHPSLPGTVAIWGQSALWRGGSPGNCCQSGTKCPLGWIFPEKIPYSGTKVSPSAPAWHFLPKTVAIRGQSALWGGFLPERYLIRGQKYFPRRPYGISSRKPLPFGDKVPSGGGFLPKRHLIRGQKYLPRRPYGISSRKPLPFGEKVPRVYHLQHEGQDMANCREKYYICVCRICKF